MTKYCTLQITQHAVFLLSALVFIWISLPAQALDIENEPVQPIPETTTLDQRKIDLGKQLFHDPALSSNGKISCASCHDLNTGGTDRLQKSLGVSGKPGAVNAPTVFNVGTHFMFFWDGREETLEEQIDGPVHHPDEMATSWKHILKTLNQSDDYRKVFEDIYRSPPTEKAVKNAIAVFEQSLITPDAPFDQYLKGNENAISPLAIRGYALFKSHGCASCHQGQNLGGNMFQQFGVIDDYFGDRDTPVTPADLGRYNVTKDERDKHVFKVPSLRNIALTAPYFHDGSAQTLEEAVDVMARYQLGKELSQDETKALIAFLNSLTGKYEGEVLK